MPPTTSFRSIESLADAVADTASLMDRHLTRRAWNWRERDNTDWFLNPTTDWPAFRYGKAVLRSSHHHSYLQMDDVMSCFFIEKGVGPKVASAFPNLQKRGLIMDRSWLWPSFMEAMAAGIVTPIVEQVATAAAEPVLLDIVVSTVTDADYDEQVSRSWARNGYIRFQIDSGVLTVIECNTGDFLGAVAQTTQLNQIPAALTIPNWIGFGSISTLASNSICNLAPDRSPARGATSTCGTVHCAPGWIGSGDGWGKSIVVSL